MIYVMNARKKDARNAENPLKEEFILGHRHIFLALHSGFKPKIRLRFIQYHETDT